MTDATPTAVIETPVYTFDKLSDEAKKRALDWARDANLNTPHDWWDFSYDDFERIAEIIGIEIDRRRRGVSRFTGEPIYERAIWFQRLFCQGQGAGFDGTYRYAKGCRKAIRDYAPKDAKLHDIVDALAAVQRRRFYSLTAKVRSVNDTTVECDVIDERDDMPAHYEDDRAITHELRRLCDWLASRLADECLALSEDEALIETIEANDYTFTADGRFFPT